MSVALFVLVFLAAVIAGAVFHPGVAALVALSAVALARPARAEEVVTNDDDDVSPAPNPTSLLSADAQALLDASPDACIVIGPDGTTQWANLAAREQFGLFRLGNPLSFSMRVPELIRAVDAVAQTGRSERARWSEKVPTNRWYEAFIAACNLDETPPGARHTTVVFIRDLTEQKRLDRMREDFVANASHELRTPLTALSGFIETLRGPARNDEVARDRFLGIMRDQCERMLRLTDALLSLSRIEMRAHVRPTAVVDMRDVARYAVEMTRAVADENHVALELTPFAEGLPVRGDHDELVQVASNLIENGIKYGGDGGRVLVGAALDTAVTPPVATISVQDFGRGIAPEHVPRLTERFYRVDVEESRSRRGTGLGLAIVKHIVARHRGRLNVRSELGTGSTFTVRLPLEISDRNL